LDNKLPKLFRFQRHAAKLSGQLQLSILGESCENASVRVRGDNPACGDEIHLSVRFGPAGKLQNIKFASHGCAISGASASLMTTKLKGGTPAEATMLVRAFHDLVTGKNEQPSPSLGDLQVMRGVRKFPQRVKCAMLAWRALEQALWQGVGESVISTETDSLT
jgi:nitrogen fixation NifU-like protein